jgi:DNA-binding MarR family transcriptional regulator
MSIEKDIKQKSFKNPYNKVTVNVMFTTGWLLNKYAKILKPYNLTEQQYNVLKILRECYPQSSTVNYILEGMIDKMSNASRLVDKLVSKELVKKVKSQFDLRSVDILLTEKGIALMDELSIVMNRYENSFYGLDEKEIKLLNLLLEKLRSKDL